MEEGKGIGEGMDEGAPQAAPAIDAMRTLTMKQPPRVGPQGEERLALSPLSSAHRKQRRRRVEETGEVARQTEGE